jgi:deazaflavin-dependent oxidoreductase (nitroreductase family)
VPLTPDEAGRSVCRLETVGRSSGLPRNIEIWFAADGGLARVYLLAGGREHAHWVRNISANPAVRISVDGRWLEGAARAIEGGPEDRTARELLAAKYQGWVPGGRLSEWAATSLPVRIDLSS